MTDTSELELLQKYAKAANNKVVSSQADLDPLDRAMSEMCAWCEKQGDIVVLKSGTILTCDPSSRSVQNCKIMLKNMGITVNKILPATRALINILVANVYDSEEFNSRLADDHYVSVQQQRLRALVKDAIQVQATDIHIEVRENICRILFRRNGELYLHAEWIARVGREVASVAFNKETDHASMHFNPSLPQNASMPLEIDGSDVRIRLASMPAHRGFDMVMRVLTSNKEEVGTINELGYRADHVFLISKALQRPHGAILISGPTGSGKTTTLASCMRMVDSKRKIYTIEDPIEKLIVNATQVPVNTEKEDRDFASMGRAALRMDPNILVLGETRDEDTARILIRAAITGHLVFSTIHTHSAITIVTRLVDLGISPMLLADSNTLTCLISQRLLPTLCQHCAIPLIHSVDHQPHLSRWDRIFLDDVKNIKVRGKECSFCRNSGIANRTVVAEVIWVDEVGRQFIQRVDTFGWELYLKENGWLSMRDHALSLVQQGICDPLDAEKWVGEFDPIFSAQRFKYTREVLS